MSFFLIVSYLTSLIYAHKDQIFDKSTNIIELVKANLKHNAGLYIFENPEKEFQREQVGNSVETKNNQINFLNFKINVSARIGQYIALQNYLKVILVFKIYSVMDIILTKNYYGSIYKEDLYKF